MEMLNVALRFKEVFPRFHKRDKYYSNCPTTKEWQMIVVVYDFLKIFNDVSNIMLRSNYPTSNLYFVELFRIKEILRDKEFDPDPFVHLIVSKMIIDLITIGAG